jgi:hypothetical protein
VKILPASSTSTSSRASNDIPTPSPYAVEFSAP